MMKNRKKIAFTFVETMVVIIIIGIIAAVSAPSLSENIQRKIWISGLHKGVKSLNEAIKLAGIHDDVEPGGTGLDAIHDFYSLCLKDYMKITKTFSYGFKTQDGISFFLIPYENENECRVEAETPGNVYWEEACARILIDTNGPDKGPNLITTSNLKSEISDVFLVFVFKDGVYGGPYGTGDIMAGNFVDTMTNTKYVSVTDPSGKHECSGLDSSISGWQNQYAAYLQKSPEEWQK